MTHINDLPPELLRKCLRYICITALSSVNTAVLKSLCLICRAWRDPAQTLLFSSVKINHARRLRLFLMHSMRIELAQSVKRLQLFIHGDGGTTTIAPRDAITPSDLAKLLGFLPSILEIDVTFERTSVLHDATLEMIAFADVRPRALRINCMTTDHSLVAAQLCSVWPSVEHVSISGSADAIRAPGASKPQFGLYEFEWRTARPPGDDYLQWMLHHSRGSLQILSFTTISDDIIFLQMLLNKVRGTLRALRLPRAPKRLLGALGGLEKLEEFKLNASIPPLPILNALPPTVQHLAFGIKPKQSRHSLLPSAKFVPPVPPVPVPSPGSPTIITSPTRILGTNSPRSSPIQMRSKAATAIVGSPTSPLASTSQQPPSSSSSTGTLSDILEYVRKAPSLRTVTYSWCTDEGSSDVVALKILCVEKGIDLRCFRHEFGWFSPSEREEMIKCDQFPRYVPISKAHARVPSIPFA